MPDHESVLSKKIHPVPLHDSPTIKLIPVERHVREVIRQEAHHEAHRLDASMPLTRSRLERSAEEILRRLALPRGYLGWTMVALASAFWQPQVMNVPYHRRLLLLPHCMRNTSLCAATYSREGLQCLGCGSCSLGWLTEVARTKGYRVLIAEGSPVVLRLILNGEADALLGVACLNSLEKSLERILMAGVPCMAVPLLLDQCQDTATDEDWILEMIETPYVPQSPSGRSYLPLMRLAVQIVKDDLEEILPREFGRPEEEDSAADPLSVTQDIGYSYLQNGGKYYRPFITLGIYDALSGGPIAKRTIEPSVGVPDAVRRVALAVEIFHKASLIHDDIEDGDRFRYGRATLHEQWGVPIALNVGDYLIGLGYRALVWENSPPEFTADIVRMFSQAHLQLSSGQGAELWLSRNPLQPVRVPQVLRIYAMKTAPAFEVCLLSGLRLAGPLPDWVPLVRKFAHAFGVAFQIQNDLADWEAEEHNKKLVGTDILSRRPTLFWALGWHFLGARFAELMAEPVPKERPQVMQRLQRIRREFERVGIFAVAETILQKERLRTLEAVQKIPHEEVRIFLEYLTESALRIGRT